MLLSWFCAWWILEQWSKGTYDLLGRNFARKGIVTVIPDYTLSPNASYDEMTKEIAAVINGYN
jgi:acetyl esterase/lipase